MGVDEAGNDQPVEPLDLPKLGQLTFEEPDEQAFPCLRLARAAAAEGGTAPCVMNAANEVAVQAFLDGQLGFNGIPEMIDRALETVERQPLSSFDDLYLALEGHAVDDVVKVVVRRGDDTVTIPLKVTLLNPTNGN